MDVLRAEQAQRRPRALNLRACAGELAVEALLQAASAPGAAKVDSSARQAIVERQFVQRPARAALLPGGLQLRVQRRRHGIAGEGAQSLSRRWRVSSCTACAGRVAAAGAAAGGAGAGARAQADERATHNRQANDRAKAIRRVAHPGRLPHLVCAVRAGKDGGRGPGRWPVRAIAAQKRRRPWASSSPTGPEMLAGRVVARVRTGRLGTG